MKYLTLVFLLTSPAFATTVSVTIDGESYTCKKGSGAACECKTGRKSDGEYIYGIYFNGSEIHQGKLSYPELAKALADCKEEIKTIEVCK